MKIEKSSGCGSGQGQAYNRWTFRFSDPRPLATVVCSPPEVNSSVELLHVPWRPPTVPDPLSKQDFRSIFARLGIGDLKLSADVHSEGFPNTFWEAVRPAAPPYPT